jgi:hypothetical protein
MKKYKKYLEMIHYRTYLATYLINYQLALQIR